MFKTAFLSVYLISVQTEYYLPKREILNFSQSFTCTYGCILLDITKAKKYMDTY